MLIGGQRLAWRVEIDTAERVKQAGVVFETYGDEIRAMISLSVKEQSEADDMFQDLFLSIVQTPIPPDTDRVPAYLYRVITNDVIDETRRLCNYAEFVREYREQGNHRMAHEAPENGVIELEETHEMLESLRKRLPSHEAEAVIRSCVYGNKAGYAAKKMDLDRKTFSQYLYRGKTRIRRLLGKNREKQGDMNEYSQQPVEL
jgi:RNA polymerase sigma factor (sigma-70 family)